jgi:hypothetical protein
MRILPLSAFSILLVMPLGCGSEATTGDDLTSGSGGSSPQAGSTAGPAGAGGNSATGGSSSAGSAGNGTAGTTPGNAGRGGSGTSGNAGAGGSAGMTNNSGGQGGTANAGAAGGGNAGAAGNPAGAGGALAGSGGNGDAGRGGVGGSAGLDAAGGKGTAGAGGALANCVADGNITYTLARNANPSAQEQMAYDRITTAMDRALEYYNCHTNISRTLNVSYVPSVQTADGNPNGNIRYGSMDSMNYITAMHETSHVLGVGDSAYDALIVDGVFTGPAATAEIREITGDPSAEVHGDNQHFWPYGLNYVSEVMSETDLLNHMRIVVAIREDLGL